MLSEQGPIVALARKAGEVILGVYARGAEHGGVEWKDDHSPLTAADRASHELIAQGLAEITPGIPVISEEGRPQEDIELDALGDHWMVDPLDGTKEFLKRSGEFTVNVALIRGGRPVAGVVHAPALGQSWLGGEGGARRCERGNWTVIGVRKAELDALRVVASRDHAGARVRALLAKVPGADTLSRGSSLKFCLIAEGRADLYLRDGPTMEWDTAAAQAVLEAAGGGVFTMDGEPLRYGKPELRNPHFVAVGDPELNWRALIDGSHGNA